MVRETKTKNIGMETNPIRLISGHSHQGATTLVCRFGDYLTKNKSCCEGRPSLLFFAAPFTFAAGANLEYCEACTISKANLCIICQPIFS